MPPGANPDLHSIEWSNPCSGGLRAVNVNPHEYAGAPTRVNVSLARAKEVRTFDGCGYVVAHPNRGTHWVRRTYSDRALIELFEPKPNVGGSVRETFGVFGGRELQSKSGIEPALSAADDSHTAESNRPAP